MQAKETWQGSARALALALLAPLAMGAAGQERREPRWQPIEWVRAQASSAGSSATALEVRDGGVLVVGPEVEASEYELVFVTGLPRISGLWIEAIEDPTLPRGGPGVDVDGGAVLTELELEVTTRNGTRFEPLELQGAVSTSFAVDGPPGAALDRREETGWVFTAGGDEPQRAVFLPREPPQHSGGARFRCRMRFDRGAATRLGGLRIAVTDFSGDLERALLGDPGSELAARVRGSVERGVRFLLDEQELDGTWKEHQPAFASGLTALAVYTLLECGLGAEHPAVRRGHAALGQSEPAETYTLACQLLALAAHHGATGSREDLERMRVLTDRLIGWQKGGFGYPRRAPDISNTQYAALGLWAAAEAGVDVDERVWVELAEHVLGQQETADSEVAPAGFTYRDSPPVNGSLTAAGVIILAICQRGMASDRRVEEQLDLGLRRGMAWLERHFSVRENPLATSGDAWLYYYLYGLERVGALTGRAYIGGRPWYAEGASALLEGQGEDGSWRSESREEPQSNTCFALLFLTRATAPPTGEWARSPVARYASEPTPSGYVLRVAGDDPMTLWLEGADDGVDAVEFRLSGGNALAADGKGLTRWRFASDPGRSDGTAVHAELEFDDSGWSAGDGGFGLRGGPRPRAASSWDGAPLALRAEFDGAAVAADELALLVDFAPGRAGANAGTDEDPGWFCLYDEQNSFAEELFPKRGNRAVHQQEQAFTGRSALFVRAGRSHNPKLPGWSFRVARDPGPGEYRYIHFAWKAEGVEGILLELADGGRMGDAAVHYLAGERGPKLRGPTRVDKRVPKDWEVVTRDLYRDFGGEARITGIAFVARSDPDDPDDPDDLASRAQSGAWFDSVYLAQSKSELKQIERSAPLVRAVAAPADAAAGEWRAWLNGVEIAGGARTTHGFERVVTSVPLAELVRPGRNVLAFTCSGAGDGAGPFFDARLEVPAAFERVSGGSAFAVQHSFETGGRFALSARARRGDLAETTAPLFVQVRSAADPLIERYASDASRDLLQTVELDVSASSEYVAGSAAFAVDARLAWPWICADGDREPRLSIELSKPVRAERLVLTHAVTDELGGAHGARARLVAVHLNGKARPDQIVEMLPDDRRKTEVTLGGRPSVRRLELIVLERSGDAGADADAVGFAEVELHGRR